MSTRQMFLQLVNNPNYAAVLCALRRPGSLTRNQISAETGLAIPTVSRIVSDMIKAGLLMTDREVESKAGRPATLVSIAPENVYFAGIDLGGSKIAGTLVDLSAAERAAVSIPTVDITKESLRSTLVDLFENLVKTAGISSDQVVGLGLGLPGTVDPTNGVLIDATNLRITNWDIARDLSAEIGLPVYAENDANAAALGEYYYGAEASDSDLVFVSVGTGIGAGLLLDGKIYRGALGQAGELGHVVVDPAGPPCTCGRSGCLEAYAGGWAVARAYADRNAESSGGDASGEPSAEDVFRFASGGDESAREILTEASKVLGLVLANLVNTLGVNRIVLGGGMIHNHDAFLSTVRSQVMEHLIGEYEGMVEVCGASLGLRAGVYGACALVLNDALRTPTHPSAHPQSMKARQTARR